MTSEMARMSFNSSRHSAYKNMSLDRKAIGYNMGTINEPIYENELVINVTMQICYEGTNPNPNSIYIPINICLENELVNANCVLSLILVVLSILEKDHFQNLCGKKVKNSLQVRTANNSVNKS